MTSGTRELIGVIWIVFIGEFAVRFTLAPSSRSSPISLRTRPGQPSARRSRSASRMLIMSAGDYRFADYTRTGLPLVAIMIVTLSALLVFRYELH